MVCFFSFNTLRKSLQTTSAKTNHFILFENLILYSSKISSNRLFESLFKPRQLKQTILYSSKIKFKPRQRRLSRGYVTGFVSSIYNLKTHLQLQNSVLSNLRLAS
ncbi:Uncharacterised protein [Streptococcus pneumoniae]|nr:Uncharacterised protein [Streptococcus pneumoniae]